jgi:hypothetical protein
MRLKCLRRRPWADHYEIWPEEDVTGAVTWCVVLAWQSGKRRKARFTIVLARFETRFRAMLAAAKMTREERRKWGQS